MLVLGMSSSLNYLPIYINKHKHTHICVGNKTRQSLGVIFWKRVGKRGGARKICSERKGKGAFGNGSG